MRTGSTFGIESNVFEAAIILNDKALLAKLSAGDMAALDTKHHLKRLTKLYHTADTSVSKQSTNENSEEKILSALYFAELVAHIE